MSEVTPAISNAQELLKFFTEQATAYQNGQLSKLDMMKKLDRGVMVTTKIRRDVLTGTDQGEIVLAGCRVQIEFRDLHGGVWQAQVPSLRTKLALNKKDD